MNAKKKFAPAVVRFIQQKKIKTHQKTLAHKNHNQIHAKKQNQANLGKSAKFKNTPTIPEFVNNFFRERVPESWGKEQSFLFLFFRATFDLLTFLVSSRVASILMFFWFEQIWLLEGTQHPIVKTILYIFDVTQPTKLILLSKVKMALV